MREASPNVARKAARVHGSGDQPTKGVSLDLTVPFGRRKNKSHGDAVVA
jgi:hypothetical protein